MRYEWTDRSGDIGSLYTNGGDVCLRLSEDPNEDEDGNTDPISVVHWISIPTARALHKALGRALEEVDPRPVTDSINSTLAACSAPLPEIVRVHPTGAGDQGSVDLTTSDGLMRYAVQQVLGKSLRDVTAEELERIGLKPRASQSEPHPTGNGGLSILHPRPFFWESNMCHGPVNCPRETWGNVMTLEQLLQHVPNALDGKETHHPQKYGCPPIFGFRLEHTGPRTLREYLEAP